MLEDFTNDIPITISEDVIKAVQQTSDLSTFLQIEESNNNMIDDDDKSENSGNNSETEVEYKKIEEEKKKFEEKKNYTQGNNFVFKGVTVKDNEDKNNKRKYYKRIITKDGQFLSEIGILNKIKSVDNSKKCHCSSNKKYKICCKSKDIIGDFDKDSDEFFCDLDKFKKFNSLLAEKEDKNEKNNYNKNISSESKITAVEITSTIEKKIASIYI